MSIHIRPFGAQDDVGALTALLHRAYAPLGAMGLNFTAVTQSVERTRERLAGVQAWVAVDEGGVLVGSVTASGAYDPNRDTWARATPWFYRSDTAHLHQLAVEPAHQGQGIGPLLIAQCEQWAAAQGYGFMALDTAVPATHLRQRYARLGYVDVDEVQWAGKTYRSVVMARPLGTLSGAATLSNDTPAHHAAVVRCLWAHFQARDWALARRLLHDDARLHWVCSGEVLMDADAIIRVNAIYPEGWHIRIGEVSALCDGRVHSLVEVRHGAQTFIANTLWRFRGAQVAEAHEYWATVEAPPAWRTAAAIGAYRRVALPGQDT